MSFPANPVDGQRYKNYLYDESIGAWNLEPRFIDGMPVGISLPFYGNSPPVGWMWVPRQTKTISRAQYSALWDVLDNVDWYAPDAIAAGNAESAGTFHLPTSNDAFVRDGVHASVDSVDTTNDVITLSDEDGNTIDGSSDIRDGTPVRIYSDDTLPGGITDAFTTYYLHWDSGNSGWSLHSTEQNAIDDSSRETLTSAGAGNIYATQRGVSLADAMQRITGDIRGGNNAGAITSSGALGHDDTGSANEPGIEMASSRDQKITFDSANSPGAKTSNESRGKTAYGRYIIKVEPLIASDTPASAMKYDTGWVANSDWTNVELPAVHNLNAPLSELLVHFFISTDGTDANSFELKDSARTDIDSTSSNSNEGFTIYQVSDNELKIQTGSDGLIQVEDSSSLARINTESYYYRIVVYKPTFLADVANVPIRTLTGNYTIGSSDATQFNLDRSGGGFTVTLPNSSNLNLGHEIKFIATDDSTNTATLSTQGSDSFVGPGMQTLTAQWHEVTARLLTTETWYVESKPTASALIEDQKASETNGGTSSTSRTNRDLNTKPYDTIGITLDDEAGQFTVPAGTYVIEWWSPFYRSFRLVTWCRDVTNGEDLERSESVYADDSTGGFAAAHGKTKPVTFDASTTLQIDYEVQGSHTDTGLGLQAGTVVSVDHETYTRVWVERV